VNAPPTGGALRTWGLIVAVGVVVVAKIAWSGSGSAWAKRAPEPLAAGWHEIAWPFLLDQWGTGRAFRCDAARCGAEAAVYLRTKVGFCNCATGVADDTEIDRVADFDLIEGRYTPLGEGRPVAVGGMRGRARAFAVDEPLKGRRDILAIALSSQCDAVIATMVADRPIDDAMKRAALVLIDGGDVRGWVQAATQ
jgi:hypothetical protein